jgi:hypothetical protein
MSDTVEDKTSAAFAAGDDKKDKRKAATPVTPEGGDVEKRPADKAKSADEAFLAILDGEELSEDFKIKVSTVFEAALLEKEAEIAEQAEIRLQKELAEQTEIILEEISDRVQDYMDIVAEQWANDNMVEIESALKVEVAESLIESMKGLLFEHNIEVDENEISVVNALEERNSELEEKYNRAISMLSESKKSLEETEKKFIVNKLSEDLSKTDMDRLEVMAEGVSYRDMEEFEEKLSNIKETFFVESTNKTHDETEYLEEELLEESSNSGGYVDPYMNMYVQSLSKLSN